MRRRPGPPKQFPHQISLALDDDSYEFITRMADCFGVKPQDVARGAIQKAIEHFDQGVEQMVRRVIAETDAEVLRGREQRED